MCTVQLPPGGNPIAVNKIYQSTNINYIPNKTANILQCNNNARLCNHCCRGKAIGITYSECVFVPLDIQRALRMRHIVNCEPVELYNIFPHYLIYTTIPEQSTQEHCQGTLVHQKQ
jgi:hypothetical protein